MFGGETCREIASAKYFKNNTIEVSFCKENYQYIPKIVKSIIELEDYLGFLGSQFKLERYDKLMVKVSPEWNYNEIMFSIFLTSFRASVLNRSNNLMNLERTSEQITYNTYDIKHLVEDSFKHFKKALPLIKKIKEIGYRNYFEETKEKPPLKSMWGINKYGVSCFCNSLKNKTNVTKANGYLKEEYKIKPSKKLEAVK